MSEEQIFNSVVHALESTGTPYMLVGSFSTNFYGVPCATHDLDVVIEFDALDVSGLIGRLGPEFFLAPQGSFEAIAVTRRHIIRVRGSGFTIELFVRSNDEHDRERFTRRRRVKVFDRETYLPTPEDVVIIKLRWAKVGGRHKDESDVTNVVAFQGDRIDWTHVERWCDLRGTRGLLGRMRAGATSVVPA